MLSCEALLKNLGSVSRSYDINAKPESMLIVDDRTSESKNLPQMLKIVHSVYLIWTSHDT